MKKDIALDTLGTLLPELYGRDAVHVAVVSGIVAEHGLQPGDHVSIRGFGKEVEITTDSIMRIGIIDPFLNGPVNRGDQVWVLIYPRTIKNLRHVWEHPSVPDEGVRTTSNWSESEAWLRGFIEERAGAGYYEEVIAEAVRHARDGGHWDDETLSFGFDIHGNVPDEFYTHLKNVTGVDVRPENRAKYFSCAC